MWFIRLNKSSKEKDFLFFQILIISNIQSKTNLLEIFQL